MKRLLFVFSAIIYSCAFGQPKEVHVYGKVDPAAWIIPRTDILDYSIEGAQRPNTLLLRRKIRNYRSASIAYPKGLDFSDGVIEADMAWPTKQQGGFLGIAFRIQDQHHYQVVYFRPESSGTINAIQYMPQKKPVFDWWDYEADTYQAKATLPLNDWFHVKLLVKGNTVTVFVNNATQPAMIYNDMDRSLASGSAGFWLGNTESAEFKNLTVTAYK